MSQNPQEANFLGQQIMFFKKRYPIHDQLDHFVYNRRHFLTTPHHKSWIKDFIRITGVQDAEDITPQDIQAFVDAVQDTRTPYTATSALAALRLFMSVIKNAILSSETHMTTTKMGRPPKTERNKEILKKRKAGWTIRKIGEHYGIKHPTVLEIIQRTKVG